MSDREAATNKPTSTQDVADFQPLGKRDQIIVSVVMVPPSGTPKAWGHAESGACMEFAGSREAMLPLYHRLREAGRATPPVPVLVNARDFENSREIPRTDCPIHVLPEIAPGSAIAFAPY